VRLLASGGRFALQPYPAEFQALERTDVCEVRDIVGLYLNPPGRAPVLCVDGKSQIQGLDWTQPLCRCAQRKSNGARRLHAPRHHHALRGARRRHRGPEFRKFLDAVEAALPDEPNVHLILDNYDTHKTALIGRRLAKRPRFHLHFTPTGGSWLNLVERWLPLLSEKEIKRGAHPSTRALEAAILQYLALTNGEHKPFV
jgi:transposase